MQKGIKCSKCGYIMPRSSKFCPECGTKTVATINKMNIASEEDVSDEFEDNFTDSDSEYEEYEFESDDEDSMDDEDFEDDDSDSEDFDDGFEDDFEEDLEEDFEDDDSFSDDEDSYYEEELEEEPVSYKKAKTSSNVDKLTGLKSFNQFSHDLKKVPQENLAIIYADVNDLKATNDSLGHAYGDILLKSVAKAFLDAFPDCCYRKGGDEIIVILNGIGKNIIQRKIDGINNYLAKLTEQDKDYITYSVSIGYEIGNGSLSRDEIVDRADAKMYKNKELYKKSAAAHPKKKYNPNHDHYYDDVLPELMDEISHFPTETILKIVLGAVLIVASILYCVYYVII